MENYLTFDKLPQEIKEAFHRNKTISVAFVKKDGSVRHIAFRRNLKSYVKSDSEKSEKQANVLQNNNLMQVYDTNIFIKSKKELEDASKAAAKSYRRFSLSDVLAFMVGGVLYDFRKMNNIQERYGDNVYNSLTKSMINAMKHDQVIELQERLKYMIKEIFKSTNF